MISSFIQGCVDGLVISNTTVSRPESLTSKHKAETGGLSGQPLQKMSTEAVRDMYRLTNGKMVRGKVERRLGVMVRRARGVSF